ncbi:glycogen debranching protein [Photobacterium aquae]|uniref:Glycogen debranching protein n=2 Tax=Photobacterium aquae TaxID=1195763 RepID=A0A0J1H592_9GAMM|nr:glycogen debranching protein [Photobacterium aquae]
MGKCSTSPFKESLYVKGTFNGWGDDTPMVYVGEGVYQAVVCLSADSHNFKISDQQGTEALCFAADKYKAVNCYLGEMQRLIPAKGIGNDLVFDAPETGLYTIAFSVHGKKYELTVTQGGDMDDCEPTRSPFRADFNVRGGSDKLMGKGRNVLEPEVLFEKLAIRNTQSVPYVFGDNIDGYYDGRTHAFVAAGKYRHKQGWYLGTYASFVDGCLNNKEQASHADLLPYGVTHSYCQGGSQATETMMLISGERSGRRSAAIQVTSSTPAELAILPQLNLAIDASTVSLFEYGVVYALSSELRQPGTPSFIALCADKPFNFEEMTFTKRPELKDTVFLSGHHVKPYLCTKSKETSFTLYLAFAETQADAEAQARQLVELDGVICHQQQVYNMLTHSYLWTSDLEYNRALMWAKAAGKVFVSHEYGMGIWAGLPWFKDCWGRDSFIALPGITLVNGDFHDAKAIIDNFSAMQLVDESSVNYGRIPNRVTSLTNMIYNTTDGTPWMVREVWDYLRYSGDIDYAKAIYPVVQTYIDGIEKYYLDSYGLMTHRDPDTWMDAKLEGRIPWSARGNRANDIQALWYTSLLVAVELAKLNADPANAERYLKMAEQVKQSFELLFWDQGQQVLADRLYDDGCRDLQNRSNQLMTLTVPFDGSLLDRQLGAKVVKHAVSSLLFPWGITSLAQDDPIFHPFHANREEYHKDAAYHNGTIWGWNAGFTVSSLIRYGYSDFAYQLTQNLADQILHIGHRGTMSENLDAFLNSDGERTTSGTYAQAWSVSEFTRNGYQDYLGFSPQLLERKVTLSPCMPSAWHEVQAELRFGRNNQLNLQYQYRNGKQTYQLSYLKPDDVGICVVLTAANKSKHQLELAPQQLPAVVVFDPEAIYATVDGVKVPLDCVQASFVAEIGELTFAQPDYHRQHEMLAGRHILQEAIQSAGLESAVD